MHMRKRCCPSSSAHGHVGVVRGEAGRVAEPGRGVETNSSSSAVILLLRSADKKTGGKSGQEHSSVEMVETVEAACNVVGDEGEGGGGGGGGEANGGGKGEAGGGGGTCSVFMAETGPVGHGSDAGIALCNSRDSPSEPSGAKADGSVNASKCRPSPERVWV